MSLALRKPVLCYMRTTKTEIRLRSLISAFVDRCLDSRIHILGIPEISGLLLVSVAEQPGLSLTWSQTPDDRFSCDLTHFICLFEIRKLAVMFPLAFVAGS